VVLVEQAYVREGDAGRRRHESVAQVESMAKMFAETGKTVDLTRLSEYAKSKGISTDVALTS